MTDLTPHPMEDSLPGGVVSIHVAAAHGDPLVSVSEVRAVCGRGLEGDRHYRHAAGIEMPTGRPSRRGPRSSCDVTLIEIEALAALEQECGITLSPGESRRNILTRGISLYLLVGQQFHVGQVRLHGIKLSRPCAHLERLTQPGVVKGLVHRAGLRAEIIESGRIRVGDRIEVQCTD
ncbi:MAG TPA: MOSC domain-containing protein [Pseudonocardiaceae bacterium]|nr:MOSC domain-containing protein [Pseudonocardiaceae bacterium]